MKNCLILGLAFLTCCLGNGNSNSDNHSVHVPDSLAGDSVPLGAKKLISSYPDQKLVYYNNKIWFPDSSCITYDDGDVKDFVNKLNNCDIEDMFSMEYVKGKDAPQYLNDCGRGRNEQLYKKMYGANENEVRHNLVRVKWFGQKILFTSINGANLQLEKIAKELEQHSELKKYLTNASTFYWRKVRGADRLSAHSYGIAIDINTKYSNYWLWSNPGCSETDSLKYENRIPVEIVNVFERHGFIWGGRWYHYDTMHFEYRPELTKEQ